MGQIGEVPNGDPTKPRIPPGVGTWEGRVPNAPAAPAPTAATVAAGSRPETAPLSPPRLLMLPGPGDRVEVSADGTVWLQEVLDPRDIAFPSGQVWIERDCQTYGDGHGLGGWRWPFERSAQQSPCVACAAPAPPEAQFCAGCAGRMLDVQPGELRRCNVEVVAYSEFGRRMKRRCDTALTLDPMHLRCRVCAGRSCPDHCRSVDHLEGHVLIGTEAVQVATAEGAVVWEARLVREENGAYFAADLQVQRKGRWHMLGKHRSRSMMETARWATAVLGGGFDDAGG